MYAYIGWRLIGPAPLETQGKWTAWTAFFFLWISVPLSFILRFRRDPDWLSDAIGWIAYLGLGFLSIVLAFLLLRDGAALIVWGAKRTVALLTRFLTVNRDVKEHPDPERRQFLMQTMNLSMVGAAAMLSGYGIFEARSRPAIEEISVPIQNLPEEFEGFRIVQISDIHVGPTIKRAYVQGIVDQVNHISKDVICFTGDLADGSVPSLREEVAPLKALSAPFGTFFVTGNHEYYSGVDAWTEEVQRLGFTVLVNEHRILEKGKARMVLAGITEYRAGRFKPSHAPDPRAAITAAPIEMVKILLAHQPQSVFEASVEGYDLQLSGHTHGGQYMPWNLLVDWYQPFIKGLYRYRKTWLYVNRGAGYWGPPLRLGVPAEITVISLNASA